MTDGRVAGWLAGGGWAWAAPVLVAVAVAGQSHHLAKITAVLVGAGLIAAVATRPGPFVAAVPVIYPLQLFALAGLYRAGVNASVVRDLGYWIEAVAAGLGLRAVRNHLAYRLDAIDWAALAYLLVVGLYRLAPTLFVQSGTRPPTSGTVLDPALRNDTLFVVMFLAVRHLGLDDRTRRRFAAMTFAAATAVAAAGMYEFAAPASWNHFAVHTLGVTTYQLAVLRGTIPHPGSVLVYTVTGGHRLLRIGSVFVDQLECGFFLTAGLALGCEWLTRRRAATGPAKGRAEGSAERRAAVRVEGRAAAATTVAVAAATVLVALGVVLTQTRDAVLASGVVLALAVRPLAGRRRSARIRLAAILVAAAVVIVPIGVRAGLATRTSTAINGSDQSTQQHLSALSGGARALVHQPLGRGLGTGATNGLRFSVAGTLTSEDQYLQIGNETGILSLLPFLALTGLVARGLWRAGRAAGRGPAAAWTGAFIGLALAGLLLQVWLSLVAAVIVWTAVGMELPPAGDPAPGSGLPRLRGPAGAGAGTRPAGTVGR